MTGNPLELLASPLIHERAGRHIEHRPWPAPRRSWVMAQTWLDLLFAHWPLDPQALRPAVPRQLELDTLDGRAWLGITPFEVRNLRLRPTLPVPRLSSFPEINVRTYVTVDDKPGIYFFSLDAASRLAVEAARRLYRLPYFRAEMKLVRHRDGVDYDTRRRADESAPPAAFRAAYRGLGDPSPPSPGTLEHWLTERYCLYTLNEHQQVLRAEINHPPWPVQAAEADISLNTMIGLDLEGDPVVHYAARQDVVFWSLEPAGRR